VAFASRFLAKGFLFETRKNTRLFSRREQAIAKIIGLVGTALNFYREGLGMAIPNKNPFDKDVVALAQQLYSRANILQFPKDFVGRSIGGIFNGYLILDSWDENDPSECSDRLNKRREDLISKATARIEEQLNTLAEAGITDNDSARAYLSRMVIEIEAWEKVKTEFDSRKSIEFDALKAEFVKAEEISHEKG
jgi:hypothetical protein